MNYNRQSEFKESYMIKLFIKIFKKFLTSPKSVVIYVTIGDKEIECDLDNLFYELCKMPTFS